MNLLLSSAGHRLKADYAYAIIAEYFDSWSLPTALLMLRRVLLAAGRHHHWDGDGSGPLFFYERLQALVSAALTLHQIGEQRPTAITALPKGTAPDLSQYQDYCGWQRKLQPWHFVPRHLNTKEWSNPYQVFRRLARKGSKQQWKYRLGELTYYTLGPSQVGGWGGNMDMLELYLLLAKLLEASHLICVRAITEVAGETLPKWESPAADNTTEAP